MENLRGFFMEKAKEQREKEIERMKRIDAMLMKAAFKVMFVLNYISLLFWACCIESVISWEPVLIMGINIFFFVAVAYQKGYANGKKASK